MARFVARAELGPGRLKADLIDLLIKGLPESAVKVARKLGCATEIDSVRLCKRLSEDLLSMWPEEVEKKFHEYDLEVFYYAEKENVPVDDPHWSVVTLRNLDEFLDAAGDRIKMDAKVV